MQHDSGCPLAGSGREHSAAARRYADAVNLHVSALGFEATGKWVAVRLRDGRSDGVLYDSRAHAIARQLHEKQCTYVCISPGGTNPCRAESFLRMTRACYDAGGSWADPHAPELVRRLTRRDQERQVRHLLTRSRSAR